MCQMKKTFQLFPQTWAYMGLIKTLLNENRYSAFRAMPITKQASTMGLTRALITKSDIT